MIKRLGGKLSVVFSRMESCDRGHKLFKPSEERERLEGPVAPASRDAVIPRVRLAVMFQMLAATENDSAALKPAHNTRRSRHVRPLMNLVRGKSDDTKCDEECEDRPSPVRLDRNEGRERQDPRHDRGHVSICVEDASAEEIIGIDVVHAERPHEPPSEDRHGFAPPRVGRPMHQTRYEVGRESASENREREPPSHHIAWGPEPDEMPTDESESSRDARSFCETSRNREVVVARQSG